MDSVYYAWTGLGCSFGPLMLMPLYFNKANKYGAIAGIIVGGTFAGLWHFVNPYVSDITIPAMIPGFALSSFAIYLASILTQEKVVINKEIVK